MCNYTIVIVGKPNVGKSTLFNRLVGHRKSIVDSFSGITRDRNYGLFDWKGVLFSVIDTGGFTNYSKSNIFDIEIRKQFKLAIEESNIIFFVVDVYTGVSNLDKEISKIIRSIKKDIILIVNKVDNNRLINYATEFYKLGFENYYCISSENGSGTGELLDKLYKISYNKNNNKSINFNDIYYKDKYPKISILGKPNVGKSTMINSLLNKNQNIVTKIEGTTRDSIDIFYSKFGFNCILTDTAGIKKNSKIKDDIEFYSIKRSIKSIKSSDVCILVMDAISGVKSNDIDILKLIIEHNKGVLIVVNKSDLINENDINNYRYKILNKIPNFRDISIIFTSSIYKKNLLKTLKIAIDISINRKKKLKTSKINNILLPIIKKNPPQSINGRCINIKYCVQLPTYTPQFVFFSNSSKYIKMSYKKFIENQIRIYFNFKGVPIKIFFRNK